MDLSPDEGETSAEFEQELLDMRDQRAFDLGFAPRIGGPDHVEEVLRAAMADSAFGMVCPKFVSALPRRT